MYRTPRLVRPDVEESEKKVPLVSIDRLVLTRYYRAFKGRLRDQPATYPITAGAFAGLRSQIWIVVLLFARYFRFAFATAEVTTEAATAAEEEATTGDAAEKTGVFHPFGAQHEVGLNGLFAEVLGQIEAQTAVGIIDVPLG